MRVARGIRTAQLLLVAAVGTLVVTMALVVALGLWGTGSNPMWPLTPHMTITNASKYIDSPRRLALEPSRALDACQRGQVEVLVVVPSAPQNMEARSAVRESWGAALPPSWALVFYVGEPATDAVKESLRQESRSHGDLAQDTGFPDHYSSLTVKTLCLLTWAKDKCSKATFILKADDDVLVNIRRLNPLLGCVTKALQDVYGGPAQDAVCTTLEPYKLLGHFTDAQTHEYHSYLFGGYLYRNIPVDRNPMSKWHLSYTAHQEDILPPFLSGTAYVLSTNLVPHLMAVAKRTPLIRLEDVYLSGLVGAQGLGLHLTHLDGWTRFRLRWEGPCVYDDLLTAHGFSPAELRVAAHGIATLQPGTCDGLVTQAAMALNRLLSSLFPRLPTKSIFRSGEEV